MVPRLHLVTAAALPAEPPPVHPTGWLTGIAWQLVSWRRRVRFARAFRGFDAHQLRDLGLNPLDQW
jgi:uncharacterized protein YjiS (DUF1127 family)